MLIKMMLNCRIYDSPYQIDMHSQLPNFAKTEIGDNVLYEDAAYTGTVRINGCNMTKVKKINIYCNNTQIGIVKVDNSGPMNEVTLPIKFDSKYDYAQPFLHQYDLILLTIEIVRCSDRKEEEQEEQEEYYYSLYQLCVSKNKADTTNVEKMISHLLSIPNKRVANLMYGSMNRLDLTDTLTQGMYTPMSDKSILSYVHMIENTLDAYKQQFLYFRSNAKHVVMKTAEIKQYNKVRSITPTSVQWLCKNMDTLTQVEMGGGIDIYNRNYLPSKLYTDATKINFDVYENQIVVGFIKTVIGGLRKLLISFEHGIDDEENLLKRMNKLTKQQYTAPIITVKRVHLNHMRSIHEKVKELQTEALCIYQAYMAALPCKQFIVKKIPRITKTFQEILPYRIIYRHIIEWFLYGEMDIEKNGALFQVKTIDKLFEYYCLSRIVSSILDMGFNPLLEQSSYSFSYSGKDAYTGFLNEMEVANTYEFSKPGMLLRLYFQPVIFSYKFENKITLFRTTGEKRRMYTPDFCLQLSVSDRKPRYAIFDAKYTSLSNVKEYYMNDVLRKYDTNIADQYSMDAIRMIWILRGRIDETANASERYENSLYSQRFYSVMRLHAGTTEVNTMNDNSVYSLIREACTYLLTNI